MKNTLLTGKGLLLLALLALITACDQTSKEKSPESPPNIVLIFIDDMGYADVSCYGAKKYQTPNIDRLAEEGMKFTDFYASQAVCSASRASLLTGCYAERVGISGALNPFAKTGLNPNETTIAEMLKRKGYATAAFGKWHLGRPEQFLPLQQGFDEYLGLPYSNDMWPYNYDGTSLAQTNHRKAKYPPLPLIKDNTVIDTITTLDEMGTLTTRYTQQAVRFIKSHKDRPFFLYMPYTMVHVPLAVSDRFKGKSGQGMFADVMLELDWSVGQILKTLQEEGLDRNTLVIFTSDNGPWLNFGDYAGSAYPLREGKGTMWEGGPRVVGLWRWPGKIPQGAVCRKMASTIDVLPTLADITGAPLPENKIDGVSILPLLEGQKEANPRDIFYYYYGKSLIAVRKGKWKLVFPHTGRSYRGVKPGKNDMPGPYNTFTVTKEELYDLENDISETTDVAALHPEVVKELEKIADSARVDLGDRLRNQKGKGVRPPGRIPVERSKVKNMAKGKKVKISGVAGIDYEAHGNKTLTDGVVGSLDFSDGEWLGFQGQDIEVLIDMGETLPMHRIVFRTLENQKAWIFNPVKVSIELSPDGDRYKSVKVFNINAAQKQEQAKVNEFVASLNDQNARFIRIKATSIGTCPPWHPGAGGKAWIFTDEVIVQ